MTLNKKRSETLLPQACSERYIELTINELPLACPPLSDRVWDAHPRVYLPIKDQKKVICPYCGTRYLLKE